MRSAEELPGALLRDVPEVGLPEIVLPTAIRLDGNTDLCGRVPLIQPT
jgi:hypothetical protein